MIYLQLLWEFFKAGLFAVGGGLAIIPFLYDISDKTNWFTHGEIADMIAIAETTPGPVGINMSTFAGFTVGGIPGAVIATIGLALPSLIIILIIAAGLKKVRHSRFSESIFYGLRPASTGLVASAALSVVILALFQVDLFHKTGIILDLFNWKAIILAAIIWIMTNLIKPTKRLHPVIYIFASAAAGIIFSL
jgi:chromate transporter